MKHLLIGFALLVFALPVTAEKADAFKQLKISAKSGVGDLVNEGASVSGDVLLTKGTIEIRAERANVLVDADGFYSATFWAEPGKLVTFRQKRDASEVWIEGEAERVEYSEKQEVVKFFSRARVRQSQGLGGPMLTQASGAFISYDARREQVAALNQSNGESKVDGGRVEFIYQPNRKPAAPAPATTPQTK